MASRAASAPRESGMRSMRRLIICLFLAALGSGLWAGLSNEKSLTLAPRNVVDEEITVVVATRDIAMAEAVTHDTVCYRKCPADKVPLGALTDIEAALARRANVRIMSGEILRDR